MADAPHLLPQPAAQGTLAKTPFPHLLVYAHERQLSGTFEFEGPSGEGGVVLVIDGQPTKAKTSQPTSYLGRVLLELGLLTDDQLNTSLLRLAAEKRLHGQILIEDGTINDEQLELGLRAQLVRKMQALVRLPTETTFKYYDAFDALASYGGDGHVGIDPYPIVWAAIREAPPWEHVNGALAKIRSAGLRLADAAETARFSFDKGERRAIELLRSKPQRFSELSTAVTLPPRLIQLLVYCLMVTKQVEFVGDSAPGPLPDPAASPLPSPPSVAADEGPPSRPTNPPPSPTQVARVQLAQREVSSRRAIIEEPRVASTPALTPPPPRPAQPVASPKGEVSPELTARRADILARAATIDGQNYFEMLGVARDAPPQAVQTAFFALAKTWHPDRVPAAIADAKEACARIFSRLSEAHQTLSDAQKRSRYVTLLDQGSGTDADESQAEILRVVEAATDFQKAEILLKRNDFAQSEDYCRKAIGADPKQADYHALLAWLLAMKAEKQSPEATDALIEELTRAIAMNKMCERAYFYRGMLLKRQKRDEKAVRDFRHAFELNPRNIDAQREVRIFEMRRGSTPTPPAPPKKAGKDDEKGGLFGRLFKK